MPTARGCGCSGHHCCVNLSSIRPMGLPSRRLKYRWVVFVDFGGVSGGNVVKFPSNLDVLSTAFLDVHSRVCVTMSFRHEKAVVSVIITGLLTTTSTIWPVIWSGDDLLDNALDQLLRSSGQIGYRLFHAWTWRFRTLVLLSLRGRATGCRLSYHARRSDLSS